MHDGSSRPAAAQQRLALRPVYDASTRRALGAALGAAFLAGRWSEQAMVRRGAQALEPRPRWLRAVVREVLAAYHRPPADRPRELAAYVALALEERRSALPAPRVRRAFGPEAEMARAPWPVPAIRSPGALAALLGLEIGELLWLADARGLERDAPSRRLRHYDYQWLRRPGAPPRPIAAPKPRLKAVQRWILHEILDRIPPHDAAHGFVRGRSAVSHAAQHARRPTVVRLDLEDFFASVTAARVYGIFRTAGYPEAVAHTLTALSTTVVPRIEWEALPAPAPELARRHSRLGRRLATPHLPQGAPTSPALASLAANGLDRRLAALAPTLLAGYSRYADDLTFSGPADLPARTLIRVTAEIARDEGFSVSPAKTRVRRAHERQLVCGVVVNAGTNVPRQEYDRLRALLHDAGRNGAAAANRAGEPEFRAHVLGRISWVASLHPARGARLLERFERVDWDS
jgi:RNA-directed DNA polymerase